MDMLIVTGQFALIINGQEAFRPVPRG